MRALLLLVDLAVVTVSLATRVVIAAGRQANGRRHLGPYVLAKSRLTLITREQPEEDTVGTISA